MLFSISSLQRTDEHSIDATRFTMHYRLAGTNGSLLHQVVSDTIDNYLLSKYSDSKSFIERIAVNLADRAIKYYMSTEGNDSISYQDVAEIRNHTYHYFLGSINPTFATAESLKVKDFKPTEYQVNHAAEVLGEVLQVVEAAEVSERTKKLPAMDARVKRCPVEDCGNPVFNGKHGINRITLWSVIQHLNDRHKWSREDIADWIEIWASENDVDIEFKVPEGV